jgi:protein involved in polysaccharide export with SLBB domain
MMPRELSKTVLPEYVIEPPDILNIEVIETVPKSPYKLKTLDQLSIRVAGTFPEEPIMGMYHIDPGGTVNLGFGYGIVTVAGLEVHEAQEAITAALKAPRGDLADPVVTVQLAELGPPQQIRGEYLVAPDGTVRLGSYGNVSVVGKTLSQAEWEVTRHLEQYLDNPIVSLNVAAYNSKVYYIIIQGAGVGDGVYRLPATGNETVLDAIAQINGLEPVSSKRIWIARPSDLAGQPQILPVDWFAVTEQASPTTNYQIMPGDRVFVQEDKLVAFDNGLAKLLSPFERIMGFTLLGTETVTRLSGPVLRGGGNPRGARF